MRKLKNISLFLSASIMVLAVSCHKVGTDTPVAPQPEEPEEPDFEIPAPPAAVNEANVFHIDFLSTLSDAAYLAIRNLEDVQGHIRRQSGKKPLVYMVDRMDVRIGEPQPLVKLAKNLSYQPFFAQVSATSEDVVKGTGMVTVYPITDYDGAALEGNIFISGCRIKAPLQTPSDVVIYTTRLEHADQMVSLVKAKNTVFQKDGVIVGTVRKEHAASLKEYCEKKVGCRLELLGSRFTAYDLFVMAPLDFVCRDIMHDISDGSIDYYRISIEKLF